MRFRRLFQFRLATLFAVVAVLATWLGYQSNLARAQRDAVEAITQLDGFAFYRHEWDIERDRLKKGPIAAPGPAWLRDRLGIDYVDTVVAVQLDGTAVDDDALALLRHLPRLRSLRLRLAHVSERGLPHVACLKELEFLDLADTSVADASLRYVSQLPRLRSLDVCGTAVSDEGLRELKGLSNLQTIYVESSAVTDAGVADLQRALPNLKRRRY